MVVEYTYRFSLYLIMLSQRKMLDSFGDQNLIFPT